MPDWIGAPADLRALPLRRQRNEDQRLTDEEQERQFNQGLQTQEFSLRSQEATQRKAQQDLDNRVQAEKAAEQFRWNQKFSESVKAIPFQPGTPEHQNAFLNILASNPPPSGFTGTEATGLSRAFTPKPTRTPFSMGLQNIVSPPSGTSSATPAPVMGGQPPAPPANAGGMGPASRFPIFDPEGTAKAPIAAPPEVSGYTPYTPPKGYVYDWKGGAHPDRDYVSKVQQAAIDARNQGLTDKESAAKAKSDRQDKLDEIKASSLSETDKIQYRNAASEFESLDKVRIEGQIGNTALTPQQIQDITRNLMVLRHKMEALEQKAGVHKSGSSRETEDDTPPPEAKAKSAQGGYKIGGKYPGGLTYIGGDPNDESSWEKGGQ